MTPASKPTPKFQAEGGIAGPTPTKTIRTMVSSLSLFLVLLIIRHDVFVTVDAFATISRVQPPVVYTSGTTILWSSSKESTLEEEATTDNITESSESVATDKVTIAVNVNRDVDGDEDVSIESTISETGDESEEGYLMQKIKDSGVAGVISYASWELAFWTVSVPVCVLGYKEVTGHWPDLTDKDDLSKLGAEAFAFVNFARFAVPLRIGLALGTTPWIQENIVDVFLVDGDNNNKKDKDVIVEETEEKNDDRAKEVIAEETEEKNDDKPKEVIEEETEEKNDKVKEVITEEIEHKNNDKASEVIVKEHEESSDGKTGEVIVEKSENDASNMDETIILEIGDGEGDTQSTASRFRIRDRIGNLINRILRRKRRSQ